MNQIKIALDKGLSREQEKIINILVGVTMASGLSNSEKNECVKFIRDVEKYIDFEGCED
jgi:hypothetical protein